METQNKKSILRIPLLLLVCVVLFLFGVGAVSAADTSGNSTIYVSTEGDDAWDGLSPVYNTTSGPKKTITNAIDKVPINGTLYIAHGTYTASWIMIGRNITITGENQKNTIINGQNSGNSIFIIVPGITVNINNLTLTNNTANLGGAIYNYYGANLTVTNCTLTNNSPNVGGAIYNDNGAGLAVINCTFINNSAANGGAIFNSGGVLAVINCTFINNSAGNSGGVIYNKDGVLSVINCMFINNSAKYGGALYDDGSSTVINCTFTNNSAANGGAIFKEREVLSVINCTLTNNSASAWGGAILNTAGSLSVINCTLTNNTANGNGGGAISNYGNLTVTNCTLTNNTAHYDGGAIYNSGSLTVMNSSLTNNFASGWGGAIFNYVDDGFSVIVYFNRIVGNSPSDTQIYSFSGLVDARFNWWGSNLGPSSNLMDEVDVSSWLVLNIKVDPDNVLNGGNSTVTVDLLHDNTGAYHDPVNGHVPDGIVVYLVSDRGILKPVSAVLVNGSATSVFTATSMGLGSITATVDNQKVSTPITINQAPTSVIVDPVSGHVGQNVALKAHVMDSYGNVVTDGRVMFRVDGTVIGSGDVSDGLATISWIIPSTWTSGVYGVVADYSGSGYYLASANGTNLTVTSTPTGVIVVPVSGFAGQNVALKAHVMDSYGNVVTDGRVMFRVDGTVIGSVDVSSGLATISWIIPSTWTSGVYGVTAEYMSSGYYLASTNSTLLTLKPSAYLYLDVTNSKVSPGVGDKFVLTYKLSNGGPDNAANVVVSFRVPEGLEFVSASVDSGTCSYNPANRMVTWTLSNVEVGDPYLYLTLRALGSGKYTILPVISSDTFNRNTDALKPFVINVESQNNGNNGSNDSTANSTVVDAASSTVVMHNTGMPLVGFVLAILAVLGGMFAPRRK